MNNILIVSFGIIENDGRLKELIRVMNEIADTKVVCCSRLNKSESTISIGNSKHLSLWNYLVFIFKTFIQVFKNKNIDIVVADNMFASLPVLLIQKIMKRDIRYIQDVRELYINKDLKAKWLKLLNYFEIKLMKQVDVVLCANKQRAEYMFKNYKLPTLPIIFENVRILEGDSNKNELDTKYKDHFKSKYNLISTGGYSLSRRTDSLVESMRHLTDKFTLYIVGGGPREDKKFLDGIINKYKLKNVIFLDKVPMSELKYLVAKSQIGIVHYGDSDLNNKYCASGKIYEFIAEGLPIVTTENPPLKDFCETHRVGIADDTFYNSIQNVANKYDYYKNNVSEFSSNISVNKYNEEISLLIKRQLDIN